MNNGVDRFDRYNPENLRVSYEKIGIAAFLGLLPGAIPKSRPDFSTRRPETFSLAHNDLDW